MSPSEGDAARSLAARILSVVAGSSVPLDDDELAARLGVVRQQVNQVCRRLAARGMIARVDGPRGKLVNLPASSSKDRLPGDGTEPPVPSATRTRDRSPTAQLPITEDEVKSAVSEYLRHLGFVVRVAWDRTPGIDIDAVRGGDRWIIEAKGSAPRGPQQHNYFLNALGELVQRLDDPRACYGLALPDDSQYRGLVDRLPVLARQRLGLVVFYVRRTVTSDLEVVLDGEDAARRVLEPQPSDEKGSAVERRGASMAGLFEPTPEQWGLRGDPYVWAALRERLGTTPLPDSRSAVERVLLAALQEVVGVDLRDPGCPEQVWREEFAYGGMSSGGVHLPTWRDHLIPLLVGRARRPR